MTQTIAPEYCVLELSFVLDSSDSISPQFFNEEKIFINALVNKYTISSYGNKASVALFSDKAVESIYCDQYHDEKSFSEAVLKLEQIGRYTNVEDGIMKGQDLLTKRGCGSRPNVMKMMIILTDGNANIGNSPIRANRHNDLAIVAKKARDSNIAIYAVSIGRKINMKYLLVITNNSNNIIKSSSFDQLLKTSLLSKIFPNCIFNSTINTYSTLSFVNKYTTKITKPYVSTTIKKTVQTSPNAYKTTLPNNIIRTYETVSMSSKSKKFSETTTYTADSLSTNAEKLNNRTTLLFKSTPVTNVATTKPNGKSTKRNVITNSNIVKSSAASTSDVTSKVTLHSHSTIGTVILKTVSLNLTNSSESCNDLNFTSSCRCLFNVTSFPKLDLSKSDIETMFNGTCFDDKLLASIEYVSSITGSILLIKNNLETCRDEIKTNIEKKEGKCFDLLFDRFSECTVIINCEMKIFYEKAKRSKMFLENLVKFSEKSFDIFTGLNSLIKWIGL
nr:uncharacterized protein LOC124816274 [Hydra vulgaris]